MLTISSSSSSVVEDGREEVIGLVTVFVPVAGCGALVGAGTTFLGRLGIGDLFTVLFSVSSSIVLIKMFLVSINKIHFVENFLPVSSSTIDGLDGVVV